MPSILEEFAIGNINPGERSFKQDTEYGRALKKLTDIERKVLASLNESEKALFEALSEAQAAESYLSENGKFIYGYKLGALLMLEIMEGREELLYKTD